MEVLGGKVRKLRLRLDLSQEELATRAGVSRDVIAGIELGRRGTGATNLEAIARVLGVSDYDDLVKDF